MISLVVPVYNEADNIQPFLRDVEAQVREPHEMLIVYDFPEDTTLPAVAAMQPPCPDVRLVHNTLGKGVLNALKAGFQASRGDVVVVMMADRSDEPQDVAADGHAGPRRRRRGGRLALRARRTAGGRAAAEAHPVAAGRRCRCTTSPACPSATPPTTFAPTAGASSSRFPSRGRRASRWPWS